MAATGLAVVSYDDIINQMNLDFKRDFETRFRVVKGSIQCRNEDVQPFIDFSVKYHKFFIERGIALKQLQLQIVGQRDIGTVMSNKDKIIKLYGAAFQVYLGACKVLDTTPHPDYSDTLDLVIVE